MVRKHTPYCLARAAAFVPVNRIRRSDYHHYRHTRGGLFLVYFPQKTA